MPSDGDTDEGGRVFFARSRRAPDRSAEIRLLSAGIDIGSSTSHLVFSRIVYQRRGSRTHVVRREILHQSDILLTPYMSDRRIDASALGDFITQHYQQAGITADMIDTGALILTGIAAESTNAAAIGALFAAQAGRLVAVSAGDALETMLAAHGSGAVAASRAQSAPVLCIDIGGGTSKIALCVDGAVVGLTAVDIGARLICRDAQGRTSRIEPAGQMLADAAGVVLPMGVVATEADLADIAATMARCLAEACGARALSPATRGLLRLPPLSWGPRPQRLLLSGGVASYLIEPDTPEFGDLGRHLAHAVRSELSAWWPVPEVVPSPIRATVIGASQHSVQLSGNTIFVDAQSVLPLRDVPVIAPAIALDAELPDPDGIAAAIGDAIAVMGLDRTQGPLALSYVWRGDATHVRLDAVCIGIGRGLANYLAQGLPLILIGNSDVGGLIGLQCRTSLPAARAVISLDGIVAGTCDFIDIGEVLLVSGGVPVVVKSLVFPER